MMRFLQPPSIYYGSLFSLLLLFKTTEACGGFFCQSNQPVVQSGEAILFAVDTEANSISMHVQILYEGPSEAFSWILPVPTAPTLSMGTDVLFRGLFESTRPTFVMNIDNAASETCTLDEVMPYLCPPFFDMAETEEADNDDDTQEAEVVKQGSIGPFDFVVLEAADRDPSSIFRWLETNGYDQPEGSAAILNYYALQEMQFLALRLQKDTELGEIEPIVLTYDIPSSAMMEEDVVDVSRRALASVPIQLTSIAATDNMPIQVYVLGDARAVPLNYLEVELDDQQVDWLGCFNNNTCYDNDYRQRFQQATSDLSEHSFITEYAGSTDILDGQIAINVSLSELREAPSPSEFLSILAKAGVPDTRRVISIIDEYIPPVFPDTAPSFCSQFLSAYTGPSNGFGIPTASCLWNYGPTSDWTWDPIGLAQELQESVFAPAEEAQSMVLQYPFLTRMYSQLSPDQMNKDPFFTFRPELPDVSNLHTAVAVPNCGEDAMPYELVITVAGYEEQPPLIVPATLDCIGWISLASVDQNATTTSPARQVAAWGFVGDQGIVVSRSADGRFDLQAIQVAVAFGDSLVINQTIPSSFFLTADELVTISPTIDDWQSSEPRGPSGDTNSTVEQADDDLSKTKGGNDASRGTEKKSLACVSLVLIVTVLAFWDYL